MDIAEVLSGRLSFVGLAELLQFLGGAAATGNVRIFAENGAEGTISMKNGEILDAKLEERTGEDAFHELFTWQEGRFLFIPGEGSGPRRIHRNLTGLLLDALRQMDELRADQREKGPALLREPCLKGPAIEYSDVVDEEFHKDGSIVVRQGRFGSWLWVILEGQVRLHKEVGGRSIPLFCLGKGAYIGSAASFVMMNRPRSASVEVVGEALLGVLDAQRLAREFTTFSTSLQEVVLGVDRQLTKLGETLALLRASAGLPAKAPASYKIITVPEEHLSATFFSASGGRILLAWQNEEEFLELASFPDGSVFAHPMQEKPSDDRGLIFLGENESSLEPLNNGEAGMLWDRLSPTFRKMLGFSLSSIQTTLALIQEAIDVKGRKNDTDEEPC
ncbi:DUF4388 domain-containing protein [Desulfobotulus mexicanus]|nr:DUF4388 domain-containing protein [Desulfobotulus mexicanus]